MTRSVTIVNTSNWEHEDVSVEVTASNPGIVGNTTILKPGERIVVGPYSVGQRVNVRMDGWEPGKPVPFMDADGKQDFPRVEVHKPKPAKES